MAMRIVLIAALVILAYSAFTVLTGRYLRRQRHRHDAMAAHQARIDGLRRATSRPHHPTRKVR